MKKSAGLFFAFTLLFALLSGCSSASAPTASPSPTGEPLTENLFSMDSVREAGQYGGMTVSSVDRQEDYTSVVFTGEVTISGTWSSDSSGLMGESITLKLDEDSMSKIPTLSEEDAQLVLDPVLSGNEDVLTQFGPTGSSGTFTITISAVTVTDQVESFPRTAVLKEILDLV